MQKLLFILLFIPFGMIAQQPNISILSQQDIADVIRLTKNEEWKLNPEKIEKVYPLFWKNGRPYLSFLGKKSGEVILPEGSILGKGNSVVSVRIPLNKLNELNSIEGLSNLELARKIAPTLNKVLFDTRADSVHAGINLPEAYTGKDVLIGVTDWGFDYTHPMFYDTLLQDTRIMAAWDQFKTSGPAPLGYDYGTEYATPTDLINAGADTANIYSYATHGSHVAGIAGGSGAGTQYRGIAFEANYLFTTFLVDEAAVLDAWDWMHAKAQSVGKRLVINMSWGLYHFGTNDGTSLLSQAITDYSNQAVVFVTSAGNNGNVNFHIKKDFSNDELHTRVIFYDYAANQNMWGQSLHMWGEVGNEFQALVEVRNSSNAIVAESPFYSTDLNDYVVDTLVIGTDTVWYNLAAQSNHPNNNRPTMRLRIKNTNTAYRVCLRSTAVTGRVHYWNVTELVTDVGNWGMPFVALGSGSTSGDYFYGIGEPAASDDAIAIAAHTPEYLTPTGSISGGAIASFSSYGPRYDEVIKPNISGPGNQIMSSISSYTDNSYTPSTTVDFMGRTYPFARFSGTSMSSPAVAGVVALMLDANPFLSAGQVREILEVTAREDNKTGVLPIEGSTRWGHGKVNAYQAIVLALNTLGIEKNEDLKQWSIYPNPTTNQLSINTDFQVMDVAIIDLTGKIVLTAKQGKSIDVSALKSGNYFVRFINEGKVYQKQFIKW